MATTPTRDPESVYRVITLVASDTSSWEDAARAAVAEAVKTIRDLRVARVLELDTVVRDNRVVDYRVKLSVSYRVDRRRVTPEGVTEHVRRYLVVANQTVGGPELTAAIQERVQAGPCEFHVLVPATMSRDYAAARRLASFSVDPTSGYTFGDLTAIPTTDEEGERRAQERLDEQVVQLMEVGISPTGEVGDPDPLTAIAAVLERATFDEIILSTLPSSVSRWVRMDLPSRVERRFGLPTTLVSQQS